MRWTHQICLSCWTQRRPDKEPIRTLDGLFDTCCFCGTWNDSGIYVHHDSRLLDCEHFDEAVKDR